VNGDLWVEIGALGERFGVAIEQADCRRAGGLRDAICAIADRICDIHERNPDDAEIEDRCEDGRERCEDASQDVEDRCG
jgi:hypothetical protein